MICNVLEIFLSCSTFQSLAVEIYCYAICSLVLLAGVCFLKSSIESNKHLTSLNCSRFLEISHQAFRTAPVLLPSRQSCHHSLVLTTCPKQLLTSKPTFCLLASSFGHPVLVHEVWTWHGMGWDVCLSSGTELHFPMPSPKYWYRQHLNMEMIWVSQ